MPTLRQLVDDLGGSVLELAAPPADPDAPLSGRLVIHDPLDPPDVTAGDLVAAIGLVPGPEASALLQGLVAQEAAAVIAKPGPGLPGMADRAAALGIGLLTISPGASWSQMALLIDAALTRGSFGDSADALAGVAGGDLFAVANSVADIVDAPVTIEDARSQVIAFSGRQEQADEARASTILGRAVPSEWADRLRELGVFRRLATEREPLYLADIAPEVMPRLAVAIRSGDTVLGSMWAAVRVRPEPERERMFADAAHLVALHLLRHRLAADSERSLEGQLVTAVLSGDALAADAVQRLGLRGTSFRVIALAFDGAVSAPGGALSRLKNLCALNLGGPGARPVTTVVGDVVYTIVPSSLPASAAVDVVPVVEEFVSRATSSLGGRVIAAIGHAVAAADAIPQSRGVADQVLRALRDRRRDRSVADLAGVRVDVLLHRFADASVDQPTMVASPLQQLVESDRARHTSHVATCRAYLDAFGDVEVAAKALGVHANTVRYRLNQMRELVGAWWRDPDERLAMELELRLLD